MVLGMSTRHDKKPEAMQYFDLLAERGGKAGGLGRMGSGASRSYGSTW